MTVDYPLYLHRYLCKGALLELSKLRAILHDGLEVENREVNRLDLMEVNHMANKSRNPYLRRIQVKVTRTLHHNSEVDVVHVEIP